MPENIKCCKHLTIVDASVNPLGKWVFIWISSTCMKYELLAMMLRLVVCGSIHIVVVLPMSTSLTPMLLLVQSWPATTSCKHGFGVLCPCRLMVVYDIFPPSNLASRDITCTEWDWQYNPQKCHDPQCIDKRHANPKPCLEIWNRWSESSAWKYVHVQF